MHRIVRHALVAAAVVAAFALTYLAFAPSSSLMRPDETSRDAGGASAATTGRGPEHWTPASDAAAEPAAGDAEQRLAGPMTGGAAVDEGEAGAGGDASSSTAYPDFTPIAGVDHFERGRQQFWNRDYAAAAIELERANRQRPGRYYPHYLLGLVYQRLGDDERAEREYIAAREIDGGRPETLVNLARLYLEIGLPEDALEAARHATEIAPADGGAWNVCGRAYLGMNEREPAIAAFREACRLDSTNAYAWNNLGYAHILGAEFEEALAPLETATSLAGEIAYMQNSLGVVLEQLGRIEEAHAAYRAAAELDPHHERAAASTARLAAIIDAGAGEQLAAPQDGAASDLAATTTTLD